jgi:glyoxylase-like metal-dependent hydrolase (beta-lactamase superfamily II)
MNSLFAAAGMTVFERGWLSSNNVLFDGGSSHESTLVDSGYWTHAGQTVALVQQALGTRPLDRIVNTHLHSDHCGGNHALQVAFGCAVEIPSGEVEKVDRWDELALTYRATGQNCPRFRRTGAVRAGDDVRCGSRVWRAIAAPGHDPESFVLYEPELQLLISADALWENGFGVVFPELEGVNAFHEVRSTLDALSELPIRWVIPGHGRPFENAEAAVARAHRRLDGLVTDPVRHAQYAAKVLIKFHLLEIQRVALSALMDWLNTTCYMHLAHQRHFLQLSFADWCLGLIDELRLSNAVAIQDGIVSNI